MLKNKSFLKEFLSSTIIILCVLLLVVTSIESYNWFFDWDKLELYGELIVYGSVVVVSILLGFGCGVLGYKLKQRDKENEDKDKTLERVLAQSDEVLEKLDENIWESYK